MAALSFFSSFLGLAALALSLTKHHRDLFGRSPSRPLARGLRCAGFLALGGSLALSIASAGVSIGTVQWTASLIPAALLIALLLTFKDIWWRA